MKIVIENTTEIGLQLRHAAFGTVVRRTCGDTVYLVASAMDGTGDRVLITLAAGTLKHVGQDTVVIPLDATLYVHGVAVGALI